MIVASRILRKHKYTALTASARQDFTTLALYPTSEWDKEDELQKTENKETHKGCISKKWSQL
mgnify:CR=1 FL=1